MRTDLAMEMNVVMLEGLRKARGKLNDFDAIKSWRDAHVRAMSFMHVLEQAEARDAQNRGEALLCL